MRTSATTAKIDAAMALVQAELEPVVKNKGVEVDGPKAKWDSRYATFAVLHAACKAALVRQGIAIYQGGAWVQGAGERLVTRLALAGEWVESDYPIKVSRDGAQGFGGGISFAKRWGLYSMVGLVALDDPEEQQGYTDNRPKKPERAKAPAGLGATLASVRSASTTVELTARCAPARAANPTGEGAAAVEKEIANWFVHAFSVIETPDELTDLRDTFNVVKPKGPTGDIREALRNAEARLVGYGH